MNTEIFKLEPKIVWENFYNLTQVPRPSKKEEKIRAYLKKFGEDLGLETHQDEIGNIIIRKPATKGMENKKILILQSHLDMVPQKNSDKIHDFEKDPIEAYIDNEWVTANGTTLGADNGIGVAAAMAVLKAENIKHGPIEALFTTDEETGMTGVTYIKPDELKGDILLNLDSEDEGELYIGCAGGINTRIEYDFEPQTAPENYIATKIAVTGLKGGHSGIDIILNRGNANKIMNKLLESLSEKTDLLITDIEGGSLRNAIPREAFVTIAIAEEDKDTLYNITAETEAIFKEKLSNTDPGLQITISDVSMPKKFINKDIAQKYIEGVAKCPNGVITMSKEMEGIVETSTNLAVIKSTDNKITIDTLQRSSSDQEKTKLCKTIKDLLEPTTAKISHSGDYPGWQPNIHSPILATMKEGYKNKYGKTPEIKVIHAGLECGLLGGKYPELDMISFGPTIRSPHSPDEKVNIKSVAKFWDFLLYTLENAPNKTS